MVDVEQRSLGPLCEDVLSCAQGTSQKIGGIRHVRVDQLVELHVLLDDGLHVQFLGAVDRREDRVLFLDGCLQRLRVGPRVPVLLRRDKGAPFGEAGFFHVCNSSCW